MKQLAQIGLFREGHSCYYTRPIVAFPRQDRHCPFSGTSIMRRLRTQLIGGVALLLLTCAVGCQSRPEGEKSFAVPNFAGVPDQWEPEVPETYASEDEELDVGL